MKTNIPSNIEAYTENVNNNIPVLFEATNNTSISIIQVGTLNQPTKGILYDGCQICWAPVPNTRLTFMKNINIDSPNNIVYDWAISNVDGSYYAYLEPGDYKVRVDSNGKRCFFNRHIALGIEEYYETVERACIKKKIYDTIQLYGTDKVLVTGCLYNEYNKPTNGQIVISKGNQLITFINTKTGEYNFLLEYGIYDIRLRSDKQSVQIISNFEFNEQDGFFHKLFADNDNYFNKCR